jgi:hypothetical protein
VNYLLVYPYLRKYKVEKITEVSEHIQELLDFIFKSFDFKSEVVPATSYCLIRKYKEREFTHANNTFENI